ncbi:glycosyltransferase [Microbacterium aurum]
MTAHGVVVFSLEPWDDIWRRNQYLVDGMLMADPALRVLFVEPTRDVVHGALQRREMRRGGGLRTGDGYAGRLTLLEPTKWLPRLAGPVADAMLRREVDAARVAHGLGGAPVWVNDPGWAHYVRRRRPRALYDVTDDWTAAHRTPRQHRMVVDNERILLDLCDEVVVCSVGLQSTLGTRRKVRLLTNAVDVARYRQTYDRPADLPTAGTALYVGTLHEDRLDVALTARTAARLRDQGDALVLVGPNALGGAQSAQLQSAGAVLLGPRPFGSVPAYLQHASVLIVPHVVDDFTDSLDPIKLYEYRAVGRPVVTTPVAGFRALDEQGVSIVDGADFADAVAALAAESMPTVLRAGVPDWSDRAAEMGEIVRRVGSIRR